MHMPAIVIEIAKPCPRATFMRFIPFLIYLRAFLLNLGSAKWLSHDGGITEPSPWQYAVRRAFSNAVILFADDEPITRNVLWGGRSGCPANGRGATSRRGV